MQSNRALDDNPIVELSKRLPLRDRTSSRSQYSPSPQRSLKKDDGQSKLNDQQQLFSDEDSNPVLLHRWHHQFSILSTCAFPNKGLLFCGTQDHLILVFDMDTFERKFILKGHTGSVLCLTKSSDGKFLFSGGSDSLVKVWDVVEMKETHTIYSLSDIGDIFSLAWSNSLNLLFIGCQNASILFVHLNTVPKTDPNKLPVNRFDKFFDSKGPTGATTISPSYQKVLEVRSRLIEVPSSNILPYAHNGFIYTMKFFDENILISGAGDGKAKIWRVSFQGLSLLKQLDNDDSILSLTIYEQFLYCGLSKGSLKVWDLNTSQQLLTCHDLDDDDIFGVASSKSYIFKSVKGEVYKWKFGSNIEVSWNAHEDLILSMEIYEKDGKAYLVTGGNDHSVAIWDIDDEVNSKNHLRRSSIITYDNDSMLSTLDDLVSFKTVSKKPELFIDESRRCANYLIDLLKKFGADSELIPVEDGNPIVYGCFKGHSADKTKVPPRILWYGHYDVIEAEENSGWRTDPFKMVANDGYLFARGVSDNKGPTLAAIYSVAELLHSNQLESDIIFLIEGEEECGSYGFQEAINKNTALIGHIDWILLSNSYWLDESTPCLNYGLRGVISANVEVSSDNPDRHSGVDGGVSREPTIDLIKLLSKLIDDEGKVLIPNFYDPIKPLTSMEEKLYDDIVKKAKINIDRPTLLSKWKYPSLTVHKIDVSGPGNSTIIPQSAKGSLSIRIVPEQNLQETKKQFIKHLEDSFKNIRSDNHLTIKLIHEAEPWLSNPSNDAFQILRQEVINEWNLEPLYIREGGSIPSVRFLEKILDAPAAQIPCGQSTDNAHLNNEKLRVTNLYALRRILQNTFKKLPKRS
ncbi:hypothetical protein WICMUC_005342 [Wickerhamomyces mucosus]|uniref:Peptidase M20 dimerisation domain-containing protein n=1 Tax=Wickerhamomyces mucosus TaxID=1378264 RepID=A0A9P8T6D9_9ASCO|nr:hypothetical protein WICMUC_005342 [Wickerhamomyces mucosus]